MHRINVKYKLKWWVTLQDISSGLAHFNSDATPLVVEARGVPARVILSRRDGIGSGQIQNLFVRHRRFRRLWLMLDPTSLETSSFLDNKFNFWVFQHVGSTTDADFWFYDDDDDDDDDDDVDPTS